MPKSKQPNPDALLDNIVEIIERDIEAILDSPDAKISPRDAAKLTRYSSALLDIQTYTAQKEKEAKKKLSGLSNEELEKKARELLEE